MSSVSSKPALETGGFNRVKQCRHGLMLYNINDEYIGRSLDLYGEYSEGEVELFRTLVRGGDWVLDVGANIGAHTLWFAKTTAAGGGGVFAFEPQQLVFQTLCANLALNSLTNVFCYMKAVGQLPGEVRVPMLDPNRRNNFGALGTKLFGQGEPVPLMRLDDLPLNQCRLIKVDVEGMELDVLRGAVSFIRRLRPILYVENDREENAPQLIRFIESLGYELFWHRPPLYNPDNFFENPQNVFGAILSHNMLCLPRGSDVAPPALERVKG